LLFNQKSIAQIDHTVARRIAEQAAYLKRVLAGNWLTIEINNAKSGSATPAPEVVPIRVAGTSSNSTGP